MSQPLEDPLKAVKAVGRLTAKARDFGIEVHAGSDFDEFFELVRDVRGREPSIFFDPGLFGLNKETGLYIVGRDQHTEKVVHLQAFRSFYFNEPFRNAIANYMIGMHTRRGEAARPRRLDTSETEVTRRLRGLTLYHGELWIKSGKAKSLMEGPVDILPRLGMLAAYLKWQPQAIWALVPDRMIRRGLVARYGYPYVEKDFAKWDDITDMVDDEEGLAVAFRSDLEDMVRLLVE